MLNQFVALVAVITKGYGQRDLDKEGLEPVKRPQPRSDNISMVLTLCRLKVNFYPIMWIIMLEYTVFKDSENKHAHSRPHKPDQPSSK